MAILKIAKMGHPILKEIAKEVDNPTAPDIKRLLSDMRETMIDAGGVGLAAPQVHVPLRIVIFQIPSTKNDEEVVYREQVLINPVINPLGEQKQMGWEGCLSVPELRGSVPRFINIRYKGLDETGEKIDCEASGFHARVVQHECDHLDGILYPMQMEDLASLHYISEMRFNTNVE
tara:strand:- start:17 stop:541 length:525 start_codon:yes stop_codon:yes gene_type:complete